ncbi:unnamed protein product [Bursaphelenchus okinawaensis]|uniref:Serpentine receptor class gamma n=1 Tax=Bursaphelenchus okinawaensis TaxID=465554 RepID=A0A811KY55_9BILA|nr:unnamed protein product [Bursaphelenchus okinawaensis]CAG9114126.1 unnamed protein product [Bursaphelenchus okinawaensis]
MPPIYDPVMMSWFFNPFHAYLDDHGQIYYNIFHVANNIFVCVAHTGVYIVFVNLYMKRVRLADKKTFRDKNTYIQVISIGSIHFIASVLYVVQQFMPVSFYSTLLGSGFYLMSQGLPPFIYLKYNKSIRNTLKRSCVSINFRVSTVQKTHSSINSKELH